MLNGKVETGNVFALLSVPATSFVRSASCAYLLPTATRLGQALTVPISFEKLLSFQDDLVFVSPPGVDTSEPVRPARTSVRPLLVRIVEDDSSLTLTYPRIFQTRNGELPSWPDPVDLLMHTGYEVSLVSYRKRID